MITQIELRHNQAKLPSIEDTIQVFAHTVAYRYWNIDVPITDETREALKEQAEERAKALIAEEFIEGELNCTIGEREIRGWWEIQR